MTRWERVICAVGMVGAGSVGAVVGGVAQEAVIPKVLVANSATERIPVQLDPRAVIGLREGTAVAVATLPEIRIQRGIWEYRELRIATGGGEAPNLIGALSAAGAEGWETSGVSIQTPGATVVILKRQR